MYLRNRVVILNCFLFVTLGLISTASSQTQVEHDILKRILGDPYDKRIRPVGSGDNASDPVSVNINLYIRNIDWIDETKMEYNVHLTFRQQWNDRRLSFYKYNPPADLNYLTLIHVDQVWRPDTFFSNEKTSQLHNLMVPNNYIRISPNGDILYSSRISMTLSCNMDLRTYPFDEQTCSIRLASYGYTNRDVQYVWKDEKPVQIPDNFIIPKFSFVDLDTTTCDSSTNTGVYSCLLVNLKLQRELTYFRLQVYIPCVMLVLLSWTSFWLSSSQATARVILGVSALLVMAIEVTHFNKGLPPLAFTTRMDIWTGICLTFVFVSLLEFMTVNFLARIDFLSENAKKNAQNQRGNNKDEEIPLNCIATESEGGDSPEGNKQTGQSTTGDSVINKMAKKYWSEFTTFPEKIDGASRILFPLAFIIFNVIYWSVN